MPRADQVIGGLASGSGRSLDISWPGQSTPTVGLNVDVKFCNRIGHDKLMNAPYTWATTGGGGAQFWNIVKNVTVAGLRAGPTINAGMNLYNGGPMGLRPRLGRSSIPLFRDSLAAYRIVMNASFGGASPAADCDYGLSCLMPAAGGNQLMYTGATCAGFAFYRQANGSVSFIVRTVAAGALTVQPVAPFFTNFDPTEFHSYEIRISSALLNTDAVLQALVDGTPVFTATWGVGTILPVYLPAYPQIQLGLKNNSGTNAAGDLNVASLSVVASENILGCL